MPPAKKPKLCSPDAAQPTIGAAFARRGSSGAPGAAGGAAGEDAAPAAPALPPLVRERRDVLEYSDFAVNNLKNDAGARPTERALEAEAVDDEARFVEALRDVMQAHPEQVPPQSLCERLLAVLTRPRTPAAPAVPAAAYAALCRLHELHPPTAVEPLPHGAGGAGAPPAPLLRLVTNPRAWAPVDAAVRARRSGGAAADPAAAKRGSEHDWAAFSGVVAAVAAGGGALGLAAMTPAAAAALLGARLALLHTARVLADDAAARLRVYEAAAAAAPSGAVRRDALQTLLHSSMTWRLVFGAMCGRTDRARLVDNLVALVAAGAAPHPTGRPEAPPEDADGIAGTGIGGSEEDEERSEDAEAAGAAMADAEEEAGSPRRADADVADGPPAELGSPASPPPPKARGKAAAGGGVGFTPPPSSAKKPLSRRGAAEAAEADACATQLAAADGFPTPADVASAAARILGALLRLTAAAEACGSGGAGAGAGGAARAARSSNLVTTCGAGNRSELDAALASAAVAAWAAARPGARGAGGGAVAALLRALPAHADAVRFCCHFVARAARAVDADARALAEMGAEAGPSFLAYVAANAADVVRGQRSSGGCATTEAAATQAAFMVAHVVQACVAAGEGSSATIRSAVAQQARAAAAGLRAAAGAGGLAPGGAAALAVADAALTCWVAAA